jgi:membrane protease YdiL (CAAX protease family)
VPFPDNEKFARVRIARLWLWPLIGATFIVVGFVLVGSGTPPPFLPIAYATYGFLFLAALRSLRQAEIAPHELFGVPPGEVNGWLRTLLHVPVMFAFAAMTLWATAYVASWLFPTLAQYLFDQQRDAGPLKALGESGSAPLILFVVVIGPVIEEFVFRGLLMRRWIARRGMWRGIIGSSLIFALLHPPFWIGAFVVGVFLSLLYLVTRSLYVPIAFHALYNGLVTFATIGADQFAQTQAKQPTLAEFRTQWHSEVLVLLLSGWLIFRAIRRFADDLKSRDQVAAARTST